MNYINIHSIFSTISGKSQLLMKKKREQQCDEDLRKNIFLFPFKGTTVLA